MSGRRPAESDGPTDRIADHTLVDDGTIGLPAQREILPLPVDGQPVVTHNRSFGHGESHEGGTILRVLGGRGETALGDHGIHDGEALEQFDPRRLGQQLLGPDRPGGTRGILRRRRRHDPDLGARLERRLDESSGDSAEDAAQNHQGDREPLVADDRAQDAGNGGAGLRGLVGRLRRPWGGSRDLSPRKGAGMRGDDWEIG